MIIDFFVIASFLIIFTLLLQNIKSLIFFPFLYYLITLLPLFFVTRGDYFWSFLPEHILLNNVLIIFAYLFAHIIRPLNNVITAPFVMFSSFSIKKNDNYFIIIVITLIFFELIGVIFFNKPVFTTSLQNDSLLMDRVAETNYPYIFNIIFKNYYGVILVFANYLILKITSIKSNNQILYIILFVALFLIYMSQLKKSALLTFGGSCALTLLLSNKLKLNALNLFIFFFALFLFDSILQSYYVGVSRYDAIIERLFFSGVESTSFFHAYILEQGFSGIDYIPWEGAGFFGFEGTSLERELFYEQFTSRSFRYGNTPVFSITYGLLILDYWSLVYFFIIYLFFFSIHIHFKRTEPTIRSVSLMAALNIFFMPIFVSGAFKLFSIFIIFPVALWAIILGSNLLPAKEKI